MAKVNTIGISVNDSEVNTIGISVDDSEELCISLRIGGCRIYFHGSRLGIMAFGTELIAEAAKGKD